VNIKAYIESGAIEAFVLGLSSADEAAEIQQLRKQYPELDAAIIEFELQLENTAMATAEAAPSFIKQQLNTRLEGEFNARSNTRVVEMKKTPATTPVWKYIAAACAILFIASSIVNLYLYNRYSSTDKKYTDLLAQQTNLQARMDVMNTKLNSMDETMKIVSDPTMKQVSMPSVKPGAGYVATVFWDTKTKDVYLLNNNLPQPPAGKQYQLWAIVGGTPVDAGMMDVCAGVCRMKNIPAAQAFAITMEKQGGNPTPQGDMYV
jgi:anti-sigma-K factor RskA